MRFDFRTIRSTLWFGLCWQMKKLGIRYYSVTPKERYFVEEVTRVTWAKREEERTGIKRSIVAAFSA